jgi:hypothetical protein
MAYGWHTLGYLLKLLTYPDPGWPDLRPDPLIELQRAVRSLTPVELATAPPSFASATQGWHSDRAAGQGTLCAHPVRFVHPMEHPDTRIQAVVDLPLEPPDAPEFRMRSPEICIPAARDRRAKPLSFAAMLREDEGEGVLVTELVCQSEWRPTHRQPQPAVH